MRSSGQLHYCCRYRESQNHLSPSDPGMSRVGWMPVAANCQYTPGRGSQGIQRTEGCIKRKSLPICWHWRMVERAFPQAAKCYSPDVITYERYQKRWLQVAFCCSADAAPENSYIAFDMPDPLQHSTVLYLCPATHRCSSRCTCRRFDRKHPCAATWRIAWHAFTQGVKAC